MINKQVIDFFSIMENYKYAKEISKNLPIVENYLKEQFWIHVKNRFLLLSGTNWNGEIKFDKGSDNLMFFQPKWNNVSISFRALYHNPHFGLYCIKNEFDQVICSNIERKVKLEFPHYTVDPQNVTWINFQYLNINWTLEENIIRILPENVQHFSEELALLAWNYAQNVENYCEEINNSRLVN
jgi:hypothetical protein